MFLFPQSSSLYSEHVYSSCIIEMVGMSNEHVPRTTTHKYSHCELCSINLFYLGFSVGLIGLYQMMDNLHMFGTYVWDEFSYMYFCQFSYAILFHIKSMKTTNLNGNFCRTIAIVVQAKNDEQNCAPSNDERTHNYISFEDIRRFLLRFLIIN